MNLSELADALDRLLEPRKHGEDTGLRVAGRAEVQRVCGAVDLSFAAIREAARRGCDLLITHHDAWKETDADLAEPKYDLLREKGLSLYVSHDPLDTHPHFGPAAALARRLQWTVTARICADVGVLARPVQGLTLGDLERMVADKLRATPCVQSAAASVGLVGIAPGYGGRAEWMAEARALGADTFLTGEAGHFGRLYAEETGLNLIEAGHRQSESPSIEDLLAWVEELGDVEGPTMIEEGGTENDGGGASLK